MVSTCTPVMAEVASALWMVARLLACTPVTPAVAKSLRLGAVAPAAVLLSPA